jgi:hypothetical protein
LRREILHIKRSVPQLCLLKVDPDSLRLDFHLIVHFVGFFVCGVEGVVLGFEFLRDLLINGDLVELKLEGFELLFESEVLLF